MVASPVRTFIFEASGDRYLQDYRLGSGRMSRWFPTTGQVFTHKHGLLRQPNTDNTVATYDVFDYSGGAGGNGTIKDPTVPASEQYYLDLVSRCRNIWFKHHS